MIRVSVCWRKGHRDLQVSRRVRGQVRNTSPVLTRPPGNPEVIMRWAGVGKQQAGKGCGNVWRSVSREMGSVCHQLGQTAGWYTERSQGTKMSPKVESDLEA